MLDNPVSPLDRFEVSVTAFDPGADAYNGHRGDAVVTAGVHGYEVNAAAGRTLRPVCNDQPLVGFTTVEAALRAALALAAGELTIEEVNFVNGVGRRVSIAAATGTRLPNSRISEAIDRAIG